MNSKNSPHFPEVPASVDLNELELKILDFWKEDQTFQKSIENRKDCEEYIFYDGPPFANGMPHYGHILTSYVKDTVPRYFTMKGKRVERRFGWDCHGLPAENSAEKELNISGKQQIEAFGIDKFNQHCQTSVLKYTHIWEEMMTRLGRWVDFKNDYKTMDLSYMESILWVFKSLFDKGLIYEGNKVLHYCYRCQTPLSNFEAKLDDAYRLKKDLSVTVKFKCNDLDNTYFLVWTTTPWTLPSNVALAVGKDFDYVMIQLNGENYIIGKERLAAYAEQLKDHKLIKTLKGKELVGMSYEPLFPYFSNTHNAFKVLAGEFVTTEDGTGIVHVAPAFGEDDANLGNEYGILGPDPVDHAGCFTDKVSDFAGKNVHEVNEAIVQFLKERNRVIKKEKFEHNYPFCWRCDTPLIYKAIPSWYVRVTDIKDKFLKNNQKIHWMPEHIKNGIFGKWLEGAKDWAISRNRYWGTPVPVWRCDHCDAMHVIGSLDEIETLTGTRPHDLHRPDVDNITFSCKQCQGTMHRVPEVLDCWFESGSMPYAQLHYPFENKERFKQNFPADFIVEYISQTRGWFYTLVIIASALFDEPPFKNAIVHGVIFAEDGRKMSKRLKNYPDPQKILTKYGSDAMRFYLLSSPIISGKNISFSESGVQEVIRSLILPFWNAYRFFTTYANADNLSREKIESFKEEIPNNYHDLYITDQLNKLRSQVEEDMDQYNIAHACREITRFIESLNNTYIRQNRRRFWKSENDLEKNAAYYTLYRVLVCLCKISAPFLPFLSEEIYKNLTGNESVHLENWPDEETQKIDKEQLDRWMYEMECAQQIMNVGRMIREKANIKIRDPRNSVTIAGTNLTENFKRLYGDLIKEELNVKEVILRKDLDELLTKEIKLDFKKLGRKLGKNMQDVLQLIKSKQYKELENGRIQAGEFTIEKDEYSINWVMPESVMKTDDGKIMVSIDLTETLELKKEGIVRDLVRFIQILRKDADFNVSDRIFTKIETTGIIADAMNEFKDYILRETLTVELNPSSVTNYEANSEVTIDDTAVKILIQRT